MPEEETGFTFVDKRRVAAEAPGDVPETASVPEAADADVLDSEPLSAGTVSSAETDSGPSPTTYDLIGYCINLLASQAWQKLGLLADPQTGEAQPDLADAKAAIDTLGDLAARMESAPEGVLSAEMRRDLRTLLNDLRLNYVSQRGSPEV